MESADLINSGQYGSGVMICDLISEVYTNGVFMLTSRRCHVWLFDVASPVPSWHRLRRGGVTFRDLTLLDTANLCPDVQRFLM